MSFLATLRTRAAATPRRIVFPEGDDARTLAAVTRLAHEGTVVPLVLGGDRVRHDLAALGAGDVATADPASDPRLPALAERLYERRKAKGMTPEAALAHAAEPLVFGALLVAAGEVDGSVAGAASTTGDVLRAALWAVGTAPGIRTVSSSMYVVARAFRPREGGGDEEVLTFTDAGVVPDPTAEQLADIALAAADARRRIVGDEPRVAFLSYATRGSAGGPSVEKVREALARFREKAPGIAADGELQADAALIGTVAQRKAPGSPVAGRANVLVFPDLDAANIGYKLVQRLAGAEALGPIVQGLRLPCNDLSRGADADDVADVACITALMAG